MRSSDLKHAAAEEADRLASDAFDEYNLDVESWVRDAFVGEWDRWSEAAAREVVRATVRFSVLRNDSEESQVALTKVRKAVQHLRDCYIEHAAQAGLYSAQAYDYACAAAEEAAEARAEQYAEQRAFEAQEAANRG